MTPEEIIIEQHVEKIRQLHEKCKDLLEETKKDWREQGWLLLLCFILWAASLYNILGRSCS